MFYSLVTDSGVLLTGANLFDIQTASNITLKVAPKTTSKVAGAAGDLVIILFILLLINFCKYQFVQESFLKMAPGCHFPCENCEVLCQ